MDDSEAVSLIRNALIDCQVEGESVILPQITDVLDYFQDLGGELNKEALVVFLKEQIGDQDTLPLLPALKTAGILDPMFIVVITESMNAARLRRAYSLGANSFLAKPLNPFDLKNLFEAFPRHFPRVTAKSCTTKHQWIEAQPFNRGHSREQSF